MSLVKPIGSLDRGMGKNELIELAESNARDVIESGKYDLLKVYVEMTTRNPTLPSLKSG